MITVLCADCTEELHAVGNGCREDFGTAVPCVQRERCPQWPEGMEVELDQDTQLAFSHLAELKRAS